MSEGRLTLHTIPYGNDEPVHVAGPDCWCMPIIVHDEKAPSNIVWSHHAKDCREKFERQGVTFDGNGRLIVGQTKESSEDALE